MNKRKLRIASLQFSASDKIKSNLAAILSGIEKASFENVRLLLTQECALCGYSPIKLPALKKIIIILISAIVLTSCSSDIDKANFPYNIDLDQVNEIYVNTYNKAGTYELDEKWSKFIGTIESFSYKNASVSEVDEIWELADANEKYYGVIINCDESLYSFLFFDDTIITNCVERSKEEDEELQFFVAKDDDIKILIEELSKLDLQLYLQ
jgi:hypothetical protein